MYRLIYLPLIALTVLGCRTQTNERYCDPTTPCVSAAYPYCDQDKNECQAAGPAEDAAMLMDLSVVVADAAPADLPAIDLPVVVDAAEADSAPPACTVAADCPSPSPICDVSSGACRTCNARGDDTQCAMHSAATPHCRQPKALGPNIGLCVQCDTDTDCNQAVAPICDPTGACRGCALHSECASSVCITDTGLCADPTDVAYVDNTGDTISNCRKKTGLHDGAPAHPYCDIADGIMAGNPYLRVTGHLGFPYTPLSFNGSANLIIVGPGAGAANPATLFDGNNTDVTVSLSGGNNVTLILDGLELGDRVMSSNQSGLLCAVSGGATANVTLRNDTVQHANNTGISSTGCALVINNSSILNNTSNNTNGLSANGGSLTVRGSNFSGNSGTAAVNLAGALTSTLTGNNISNNNSDAVDCASGTNTTLTGNTIGKNKQGVSSNAAIIVLDSNQIFGSTGTGAFGVDVENNTTFTVTNNFIYSNTGVGMKMSGGSAGKFVFNTIVENGGGGVDCGGGATLKPLEASIVWGNQPAAGTQFPANNCELLETVTGADNYSKAIQLTPSFVSPSPVPGPIDLHLKINTAANTACCIDKVGGPLDGGSPLPDHDIDGDHRPLGGGYDVGGDEAQ